MHKAEQDLGCSSGKTWQNLWNLVEYSRIWQIAVRLPHIAIKLPFYGRSLVIELVETGGRV